MQQTSPKTYAHGVTHSRPIHASGRHIGDAANEPVRDALAGIPRTVVSGSESLAAMGRNYWRTYARNCGECYECGFKLPAHEKGCTEAADQGEEA